MSDGIVTLDDEQAHIEELRERFSDYRRSTLGAIFALLAEGKNATNRPRPLSSRCR